MKEETYGAWCKKDGLQLIPVVNDTFAAWGSSAFTLFREIAQANAKRFGISATIASQLLLLELNVTLLRALSRIQLMNTG